VWGTVGRSAAVTATAITRLKHQLAPAVLAEANLTNGAALFEQRCAACHRLFGQGQNIGPDLTGSGRKDLDYLLLNIIDPNASVPADYRITVITLHDGRVLTGSILSETAEVVTLQLSNAETKLNRAEVKTVERLPMSLMPAGLLESMTATELRDFIGYLMSDPSPSGGQTP
jgi:putative heme-binding domain-containing protein